FNIRRIQNLTGNPLKYKPAVNHVSTLPTSHLLDVAEGVVAAIERLGHVVDWACDGDSAEGWLAIATYDLIVLDLMLPDADGVGLLRAMRARGLDAAVLVVTARAAVSERVQVLDLGADEYLCKPFDFDEVQARIRSLLRL
ncbi:hypothetical protein E4T56_gene4399, partial [Termitomyces sp. T112]